MLCMFIYRLWYVLASKKLNFSFSAPILGEKACFAAVSLPSPASPKSFYYCTVFLNETEPIPREKASEGCLRPGEACEEQRHTHYYYHICMHAH